MCARRASQPAPPWLQLPEALAQRNKGKEMAEGKSAEESQPDASSTVLRRQALRSGPAAGRTGDMHCVPTAFQAYKPLGIGSSFCVSAKRAGRCPSPTLVTSAAQERRSGRAAGRPTSPPHLSPAGTSIGFSVGSWYPGHRRTCRGGASQPWPPRLTATHTEARGVAGLRPL